MKHEEKQLLFQDLCSRIPYGVKVNVTTKSTKEYNPICFNGKIVYIDVDYVGVLSDNGFVLQQDITELKPYLFPMESMTDEQYKEYCELEHSGDMEHLSIPLFDWCNKNHFDYRGLIPMGLAKDGTNLNIY